MIQHSRGFTLVETIIVAALSAVMMVALGLLIYTFSKTSSYQQAVSQSSGSANATLREVSALVLPADAVVQTHIFASGSYSSGATVLVLEIPSISGAGVVIANTYDYAVFYVVGSTAYRRLEANAASARASGTIQLSATVNSLTYTYNNADFTQVNTVTIDIQTQSLIKQYGLTLTDHRHEQLRLRNK